MEIFNRQILEIIPAENDGIIISLNGSPKYVFTEWIKLFEFLNDFYNEKNRKNPWDTGITDSTHSIFGGGS